MKDLFIVAIGGSAGSVEPLKAIFSHTLLDSAAYIIVRHLPKEYHSELQKLLAPYSQLHVQEVQNGTRVEPNNVYLMPSEKHLVISGGVLHLVERPEGLNRTIDRFFYSLASEAIASRAIAVILSGAGFDGVKGAGAIKQAGGLVIAQDPATCLHNSMPQNTIQAGISDIIATPTQIPSVIQAHVQKRMQTL